MQTFNSLPLGFEKLKTEKPYVNISKLAEGEHRFRIVQRPIAGWIDWKDKKPHRYKPENKPVKSFNPEEPMRPFWAMHVWDYAKEGLYVMEITQNGIRKALENLAMNEEWGDLTSFDFKIKKEGIGKESKYSVIPIPPKPLSSKIKEAIKDTKIRLEALYEGKDPWNDLEEEIESKASLTDEQIAKIDSLLSEIDDLEYLQKLNDWLEVEVIYEMNPKHFNTTVNSLEKKIKDLGGAA